MLKLQEFIMTHHNFRELLSHKPYCLNIREDDNLILFKYNQIESDFSNPIVQESRGIILYKGSCEVACHPFHKFFNYGEADAHELDWDSTKFYEKLDGSLIKLFFNRVTGNWQWATNGTIDAGETTLGFDSSRSFKDLIYLALESVVDYEDFEDILTKRGPEWTYLFELCSPYNRVVVPHKDTSLYFLASKHNRADIETVDDVFKGLFPRPRTYEIYSLEQAAEVAKSLPFNEEGYVAVDKNFNRVKVKSPAYVAVHRLANNGVVTGKRILEIIRSGEDTEFLNYFPEYYDYFEEMRLDFGILQYSISQEYLKFKDFHKENHDLSRKEFAIYIQSHFKFTHMLYQYLDGKLHSADQYIESLSEEKILDIIHGTKGV